MTNNYLLECRQQAIALMTSLSDYVRLVDSELQNNKNNGFSDSEHIPEMIPITKCKQVTGLSYQAIKQLCADRKIIYLKSGKKVLVNLDSLLKYMNSGE